jgi:hypothetical protein
VDLGNGAVQLPLFTLRDPMGDGSSSTIEEGSSVTKDFSLSADFLAALGVKGEMDSKNACGL